MGLLLTGSTDHALLGLVIQEAAKEAKLQDAFVGRTAVQKILYFLRVVGVPMSYRFDIHHYGPFCEEILRDVDWLLADNAIIDHSDNPSRYSNYAPGETINDLLSVHRDFLEPFRSHVQTIVQALVPLKPTKLELVATLDYLYRQQRASGGLGPWKPSVVARFQEVKEGKFSQADVEKTYDVLAQAGLVEP